MSDEPKPKIPAALLAARPCLADDPTAKHPSIGPVTIGGPPRRYTRGLHDRIVELISKGNRPHVAAGIAGIPSTVFHGWMKEGKSGNPHLVEFAEDVEIAMHRAEGTAIDIINTGFYDLDGKVALDTVKWWLERARGDGYSKEVATKVAGEVEMIFKRLESLPPDIYEMVVACLSGQQYAPARLPPAEILSKQDNGDNE